MKENATKVDDLIAHQIEYIESLADGSDEKAKANDELSKLYRIKNDQSNQFRENAIAESKAVNDRIRLVLDGLGVGISAIGLVGSFIFTKKGFKFEETGTFVSSTFRQCFSGWFKNRK